MLAASVGWDGPGKCAAALTYNIGSIPSNLDATLVRNTLKAALKVWSDVAKISFVETATASLTNSIDISFRNIDRSGGTLAQAYLPSDVNQARLAGDVEFDSSETWEVGNGRGNAAFDLMLVAVHEFGHALGLDHVRAAGSVMQASVAASQQFAGLSTADVDAILSLYAAADGSPTTPKNPNTPTTPTTPPQNPWFPFGRFRFPRGWRAMADAPVVETLHATRSHRHNAAQPSDIDEDGNVSPKDVLLVINELNAGQGSTEVFSGMCDANGDGDVSAIDALWVVNRLNGFTDDDEQVNLIGPWRENEPEDETEDETESPDDADDSSPDDVTDDTDEPEDGDESQPGIRDESFRRFIQGSAVAAAANVYSPSRSMRFSSDGCNE